MAKLLLIMLAGIILARISDYRNDRILARYGDTKADKRERFFVFVIAVTFIIYGGLRFRYNDTSNYIEAYIYRGLTFSEFMDHGYRTIGDNIGFQFINSILKTNGASEQTFILFYSIIVFSINMWFIRKYSKSMALAMFFFFVLGCFTSSLAAIKQTTAMAIGMLALDRYFHNKKIRFAILLLIGSTFHPYILLYFLVPFLKFKPWGIKTYSLLFVFLVMGVFLTRIITALVDITTLLGEEYSVETMMREGVNAFRVLVCWAPLVLSWIYRKKLFTDSTPEENIIANMSIISGCIMFLALFGTANYFGRLSYYFLVMQVIFIPWMLGKFDIRSRYAMVIVIGICYMGYFWYSNTAAIPYATSFDRITLWEYLSTL